MNGSAPKWSSTGSQTLVQRKLQPKAARACADCVHSSTPMVAVMTKTESAKVNAEPRKVTSANRDGRRPYGEGRGARCAPRGETVLRVPASRTAGLCSNPRGSVGRVGGTEPTSSVALSSHRDLVDRASLHVDHRRRQRGVVERRGHCLTVAQHPPEELLDDVALRLVGDPAGDQQP